MSVSPSEQIASSESESVGAYAVVFDCLGEFAERFGDVYMLGRDEKRFINSGKRGEGKDVKERLVMNFDPEGV